MQTTPVWNARRHHRPLAAAALVLLATVVGVTANATEGSQAGHPPEASKTRKWMQIGKASWYGRRFQGHRTASGETFDLHQLTCAHRTLPIGTLLRVTNLRNRKSVVVRVNDRGPVQSNLIVDLSYAAASALGFGANGNARVRLERVTGAESARLEWPELPPGDGLTGSR